MGSKRRVVITGMGVICPIGNNLNDFWNALKMGRSGPAEMYFKKVVKDYGATGAAASANSYLSALAPKSGGGDAL
jgi:3-oxoacyl-(acyl-carrier-protein) synthase